MTTIKSFITLITVITVFISNCYASNENIHQNKNDSIIIIGASYAHGWKIKSIAGLKVINVSIGGAETNDMLSRFNKDVIERKPKAVIIWGFINDIFRSKPDQVQSKLTTTKNNILIMIDRAQNAGIIPILATELTITSRDSFTEYIAGFLGKILGKKSYQDYVNNLVMETDNWLENIARKRGLLLLDFQAELSDDNGIRLRKYATSDGSHVSQEAYQVLSDYVANLKLSQTK